MGAGPWFLLAGSGRRSRPYRTRGRPPLDAEPLQQLVPVDDLPGAVVARLATGGLPDRRQVALGLLVDPDETIQGISALGIRLNLNRLRCRATFFREMAPVSKCAIRRFGR
ncbi:MAG: hypothetical protein GWO24_04580 [Akkermansiaceae bacterium]|nr:hypothetical protein [Akkermansiaceae bacterium]